MWADFLRDVRYFGFNNPNPFYGAEAIYIDHGWSFIGHEDDGGGFFVLVGKDKGKFFSFNEKSRGGIATDAGYGFEIGRVDVTGNPSAFTSEYFYGARDKVWLSAGEVFSAGGAYSWSTAFGETVTAKSLQISFGLSPGLYQVVTIMGLSTRNSFTL